MKVDQRVRTKHRDRFGIVIGVEKVDGFLDEIIVRLDDGTEMIFYEAELEVVEEST